MGKVIGAIFAIVGGLVSLFVLFLYMNTSAYLSYNPADKAMFLSETGLVLPAIFGLFLLTCGIVFLRVADER